MASEEKEYQMRPGTIKEVKVRNFMCHVELAVTLGAQVSFITGHNGSGKSAILAAVVAGLGARAGATNRGTKLEDLIMHGENTAVVSIRLHNKGGDPSPFQKSVYGDTIVIERVLNRGKPHFYRLLSSSGKLVSKKAGDLADIIKHFNIQVDNPVYLMNQDTSRSFLNSKSEKDFYKFFFKAAMLDDTEDMVRAAMEDLDRARETMVQKEKEMVPLLDSIASWEEKQEKATNPDQIRRDLANLEIEAEIRRCQELRVEAKDANRAKKKLNSDKEASEKKIEEYELKIPALKARIEELAQESDQIEASMKESQEIIDGNRASLTLIKKECMDADLSLKNHRAEVATKKTNLADYENRLEAARNQSDLRQLEEKKAELETKILEAANKLDSLKHDREAAIASKAVLDAELVEHQKQFQQASQTYNGSAREAQELKQKISGLEQSAKNTDIISRLGAQAKRQREIMDELIRDKKLQGKVIGPVASQIGLNDEKYGVVVEKALGGWLRSYLLEDERDRSKIIDAFKRHRMNPPMMDCVNGKFMTSETDFGGEKCESAFPTIFDLVTFKNPHVRNVIVDATNIHQQVVMPTMEQARTFYREGRTLNYCRHIFDMEGNTHSKDSDGYTFMPNNLQHFNPVLCQSNEHQIQRLKNMLTEKSGVAQAKKLAADDTDAAKKEVEEKIAALAAKIKKIQADERKLEDSVGKMRLELESISMDHSTDIQVLMDEVAELQTALNIALETEERLQEIYSKKKRSADKADSKYDKMKEQLQRDMDEHHKNVEKTNTAKGDLAHAETELERFKRKLSTQTVSVEQKTQLSVRAVTAFEEAAAALAEKGVDDERLRKGVNTQDYLDNMIAKLTDALRHCNIEVENSWDHCQHQLDELRESKVKIDDSILKAKTAVKDIEKNVGFRQDNLENSRQKADDMVRGVFKHLMDERGFDGAVVLDHDERKLKFDVTPRGGVKESGSNVKSLSGGERSYSMVCFLIALWTIVEIPFRILDEFDVFMDMLNRDHAMARLISYAVESGRQFIFLTPLAFSQSVLDDFKKKSSRVEVVRMPTSTGRLPASTQNLATEESDEE